MESSVNVSEVSKGVLRWQKCYKVVGAKGYKANTLVRKFIWSFIKDSFCVSDIWVFGRDGVSCWVFDEVYGLALTVLGFSILYKWLSFVVLGKA